MENLVVFAKKDFTLEKFNSEVRALIDGDVKKIIDVNARVVLTNSEASGNFVVISGRIFYNVIYQNTQDEILNFDATFDFSEKQQISFSLQNLIAVDKISVSNVETSSNEVSFCVVHNVFANGVYKYEIPKFEDDGDLVFETKEISVEKLVKSCEENFVVAEEFESNVKCQKILFSNAQINLANVVCMPDKVVLDGKILAELIVLEKEEISSITKEFEFKQEVLADKILPNMKPYFKICVKNVTTAFSESNEKTKFACTYDVFVKGFVFDEESENVATDLFSLSNEIKQTYEIMESKRICNFMSLDESASLSAEIGIDDLDDVLCAYAPKFELIEIKNEDFKTVFVGSVEILILCKTGSGITKKRLEIPYSFGVENEKNFLVDDVCVNLQIASFKVKAGKEIEINLKNDYFIYTGEISTEKFVKSFEIIREKEVNDAGIKVYVTKKDESVFEVAKNLNVKPELIESQNVVDGLFEQGQKVYIYSPLNI